MISTTDKKPKTAAWETKLDRLKKPTAKAYKKHILAFIDAKSKASYFIQDDIDDYLDMKHCEDQRKPQAERESTSTKDQFKAALTFYLTKCLGLSVKLTAYSTKSNT